MVKSNEKELPIFSGVKKPVYKNRHSICNARVKALKDFGNNEIPIKSLEIFDEIYILTESHYDEEVFKLWWNRSEFKHLNFQNSISHISNYYYRFDHNKPDNNPTLQPTESSLIITPYELFEMINTEVNDSPYFDFVKFYSLVDLDSFIMMNNIKPDNAHRYKNIWKKFSLMYPVNFHKVMFVYDNDRKLFDNFTWNIQINNDLCDSSLSPTIKWERMYSIELNDVIEKNGSSFVKLASISITGTLPKIIPIPSEGKMLIREYKIDFWRNYGNGIKNLQFVGMVEKE